MLPHVGTPNGPREEERVPLILAISRQKPMLARSFYYGPERKEILVSKLTHSPPLSLLPLARILSGEFVDERVGTNSA